MYAQIWKKFVVPQETQPFPGKLMGSRDTISLG